MKRNRLIALLIVSLVGVATATPASAYYKPRAGRFLNCDPIGERGGANVYAFVRNGSVNRIDPLGLQASQPTTSRACDYCGPDMTSWFTEEVNIHGAFWRSSQANVGVALRPLYFKRYAASIPYKWTKFETTNCPSGDKCKGTVSLCGTCIHNSELGNVMYGAMAKVWMRGEGLIVGGAVAWGGTNSNEDMAGVVGGLTLGDPVRDGPITQSKMCELLKGNQGAYIGRIGAEFEKGSNASNLLTGLSGVNLDDMGKQYKDCEKCPDKTPTIPHSSFAWLKTTKDMASGDWQRTYPGWPIDWPP